MGTKPRAGRGPNQYGARGSSALSGQTPRSATRDTAAAAFGAAIEPCRPVWALPDPDTLAMRYGERFRNARPVEVDANGTFALVAADIAPNALAAACGNVLRDWYVHIHESMDEILDNAFDTDMMYNARRSVGRAVAIVPPGYRWRHGGVPIDVPDPPNTEHFSDGSELMRLFDVPRWVLAGRQDP